MPTVQASTFGILLKRLRRAAGLTQEELAASAHYSVGYIGMLERGTRIPLPTTVILLADALTLSEDERAQLLSAARRQVLTNPHNPHQTQEPFSLVGRVRELHVLDEVLASNGPALTLLAGEPGIGKSRLLREAAAKAAAAGWFVVQGSCQRSAGQTPYAPLLEGLEGCVRSREREQLRADLKGCSRLTQLLPELVEMDLAQPSQWTLPPEQERRLLFQAVRRFLANIGGAAGTLLLLDDLQWAGADTFDLLTSLIHAQADAPLAVIGAYRDTDLNPNHPLNAMLADLARNGRIQLLHIGELAAEEARMLVAEALHEEPVDNNTIERILLQAGGIPFFLVSCALSLHARAISDDSEQRQVPWDVAQSIRQRVAALPGAAQDLLGVAAVIGQRMSRTLLVAVMTTLGWSEREIMQAADLTCKVRLLLETDDALYQFAHDLIREVVTSDLGTAYRALLHIRVAEALECEQNAQPEQLAYHFVSGGQIIRALRYLELAGDHAAILHAYAEAESYYRMLLEHLEKISHNAEAAAIREKLGKALIRQAKYLPAIALLQPALSYYLASAELEGVGRTLAMLGEAYGGSGTPDEGLVRLQSHMERLVAGGLSAHGQAQLYLTLTELFHIGGRNSEQLAAAQQAGCIARDTGDDQLVAEAERQEGLAFLALGLADKAANALEEAIRLAEKASDLWQLAQALGALAMTKRIQGENLRALNYFEQALTVAQQIGQPATIAYIMCLHGELLYLMGQWDRARKDFEAADEIVRSIDASWVSLYPSLGLGLLSLAQGQREETQRYLEHEAVEVGIQEDNLYVVRWAQPNLAERDLLEGKPEQARDRMEPWLDRPGQVETDVTGILPFLSWAYLELGEVAKAEKTITETFERATRGQHHNALVDALRVQALIATRKNQYDVAEKSLTQAIALGEGMPYPHAVAKAQYAFGLLCETQGNMQAASEHFQQAQAICQQLGEGLFREHIKRALLRIQDAMLKV